MELAIAGAVGAAGVAGNIWSYNQDNWQFDVQNRQMRDFQSQGMRVNRFSLFREDIRDITAMTTDKMNVVLVINTLKLSFCVIIFFNNERFNGPDDSPRRLEKDLVKMLFAQGFNIGFLFLLLSVWFAMHAQVMAMAFMTKMLIHTVRIPLPTEKDVAGAAAAAKEFERDLGAAFRIPLLGAVRKETTEEKKDDEAELRAENSTLDNIAMSWHLPSADAEEPQEGGGFTDQVENSIGKTVSVLGGVIDTALGEEAPELPGDNEEGAEDTKGLVPHLKLYRLLMLNWQPFDVYSKICTSIGTSGMLTGIAYFSLYYQAEFVTADDLAEGVRMKPSAGGWATFTFMSASAYLSVMLDLNLSKKEYLLFFLIGLIGPFTGGILTAIGHSATNAFPLVFFFQVLWIWLLCWSAFVSDVDRLPHRWRSTFFVNVLNESVVYDQAANGEANKKVDDRVLSAAVFFFHALSSLLNGAQPEDPELLPAEAGRAAKKLARVEEALEAVGRKGANEPHPGGGIWVELPKRPQASSSPRPAPMRWIDLGGDSPSEQLKDNERRKNTLEELMLGAQRAADAVHADLRFGSDGAWTPRDAEELKQYGGQTTYSTREYESQFRAKGMDTQRTMGSVAHRFFWLASLIARGNALFLMGLSIYLTNFGGFRDNDGFNTALSLSQRTVTIPSSPARMISHLPMELPRPWFDPTGLSCDTYGQRLALIDGMSVFVGPRNGSEWSGPFVGSGASRLTATFQSESSLLMASASERGVCPQVVNINADPRDVRLDGSCREELESEDAMALAFDMIAFDSNPVGSDGMLGAIAVLGNEFVALRLGANETWEVSGALVAPERDGEMEGSGWAGVALRAGRALALDGRGRLFELDAAAGRWSGPWPLDASMSWRGLCALQDDVRLLALGYRSHNETGYAREWQLVEFEPPASPLAADL